MFSYFALFSLNISNAVNPFIYAGMNPVFRREFRRLLVCRFGEEKVDNHQLEDQPHLMGNFPDSSCIYGSSDSENTWSQT